MDNSTVRIPLRARDGSIRAYALVDAADAEWANRWRWFLNNNGYAARAEWDGHTGHTVLLHRELLGLVRGDGLHGDHLDRDRLNDRRANLRAVTHAESMQNKSSYRGAGSPHRGVHWEQHARKWRARVMIDGKPVHLGYFSSQDKAAKAAKDGRARRLPYAVD